MVDSVQSTAAAPYSETGAAKTATEANGTLGKDDFMQLLVAQLSNQDPMSPTEPTEFVSQLSQFSQLEQLISVQQGLELIAITETAGTSAQMVSFIGREVEFEGSTMVVAEGDTKQPVQIEVGDGAAEAQLTVTDKRGTVVAQIDLGGVPKGEHTYYVDVETLDLDAGTYSLAVTAKDAEGESVETALRGRGEVTGVTFDSGFPELVLADGRRLSLAQILQVLDGDAALPPEHITPTAERAAAAAAPSLGDRSTDLRAETPEAERPFEPISPSN